MDADRQPMPRGGRIDRPVMPLAQRHVAIASSSTCTKRLSPARRGRSPRPPARRSAPAPRWKRAAAAPGRAIPRPSSRSPRARTPPPCPRVEQTARRTGSCRWQCEVPNGSSACACSCARLAPGLAGPPVRPRRQRRVGRVEDGVRLVAARAPPACRAQNRSHVGQQRLQGRAPPDAGRSRCHRLGSDSCGRLHRTRRHVSRRLRGQSHTARQTPNDDRRRGLSSMLPSRGRGGGVGSQHRTLYGRRPIASEDHPSCAHPAAVPTLFAKSP